MIFSGALERNPGLLLVLTESGVGWVPYLVARIETYEFCIRTTVEYSLKVTYCKSLSLSNKWPLERVQYL